jgi:hypothetical protein
MTAADTPSATIDPTAPGTAAPPGALDDAEVLARTAWIQARLDAEAPAARLWFRFWLLSSAGAAVIETVIASSVDYAPDRPSFIAGAISASLGAITLLALPPTPVFAGEDMHALPPARTSAERRARLQTAEAVLRRAASIEALGRSWIAQAGTFAIAIAGAMVLWLGYDQPVRALINFGSIVAAGELRFFTTPAGLVDASRRYQDGTWRAQRPVARVVPVPVLLPGNGGGLGLTVTF